MSNFGPGDLITNGSSAGTVLARVPRDPTWKTSGVRIVNVATEQYGGQPGYTSFVADYLVSSWKLAPLEWTPIHGDLEERYVWVDGHSRIQREVRKAAV